MGPDTATLHLPRILCLHGGGSNGRVFQFQCRALIAQLQSTFRFCFVDAPFLSDPGPDVVPTYQNHGPFRRWLRWHPDHPEVDHDTAARFILHSITTAIQEDDRSGAEGEWVGLMGFSQGAKIAASVLLQQPLLESDRKLGFRFAILLAGSAPLVSLGPRGLYNPYLADASQSSLLMPEVPNVKGRTEHRIRSATVHVHGLKDAGRPRHQQLLEQYCHVGSARLVEWDGGHRVPIKRQDVAAVVETILDSKIYFLSLSSTINHRNHAPSQGNPEYARGARRLRCHALVHSDTYAAIDPHNYDLAGTAVFISGGSKGLGRGMVLSFAKAGASYIAVGARSDMSQLAEEVAAVALSAHRQPPHFLPIKMDVTDQDSVEAAAKVVKTEFGRCDILINNAGVLGTLTPVADSDPVHWWSIFEINLRGSYLLSRTVGAHLISPAASAYQTSKLALLRLSQFLDREYANQGLVSICIHPGNSPTDIIGDPKNVPDHLLNVLTDTPELCGDTVVYLVSERREWLSGRYVNVTWDMPQLMAKREEIEQGDKLKVKLIY
ncbi:hypothetical protein N7519_005922 [Penicillium mononematosum]|uniref:uncharacterized protein n=1 Tax=Penicillium mononematosum TaxID=268346 RepID=UPI002548F3C8|nr:uncharacterized protein N7519_005922 [Penicillium mononematosum]KAJ6184621.1 hypothetical protein N7519_005922 [Penicillium mononematosum]